MKLFLLITTILINFFCPIPSQLFAQNKGQGQFPIFENGKYGCINDQGQVIIQPIFDNLGHFTDGASRAPSARGEGVAPARLGGYFGFIDTLGRWTIAPQFEYATEFQEGVAIVFQKGQYFYINSKGEKLFDASIAASLDHFKNGVAFFTTPTNKKGLWDKTGHLIADTIFSKIAPFHNDLAILERESWVPNKPSLTAVVTSKGLLSAPSDKDDNEKNLVTQVGIIDRKGRFVVPFGKYDHVETFQSGYFIFNIKTNEDDRSKVQGILDKKGQEIFRHRFNEHESISTSVNIKKGSFVVNLYDAENAKNCNCLWSSRYSYQGLMNLKGEIVFNNPRFERVFYFDETKIVGKDKMWEKLVADWQGKPIKQANLDAVREYITFDNNIEVVFDDLTSKNGIIDTNGYWLVRPMFDDDIDVTHFSKGFIFFQKRTQEILESSRKKFQYNTSAIEHVATVVLWGMTNDKGEVLCEPKFISYNPDGFKNGLLSVVFRDNTSGYVDKKGKIVWQQTLQQQARTDTMNIDFMNPAIYSAASDSKANDSRHGGWSTSSNKSEPIFLKTQLPQERFSLQVSPTDIVSMDGKWLSYKVFVANPTKDTLFFEAQDSHLNLKMQALDSTGQWRDIEYVPTSWCGNSYHTLALDPNMFWSLTTPQYKGAFATRFRLELAYFLNAKKMTKTDVLKIYSNEWAGSVNPAQFWRKKNYSGSRVMCSYSE